MTVSTQAESASNASARPHPSFPCRLQETKPWMAAGLMLTSFIFGTVLRVVLVTLLAVGAGLAIT